MGVSPTVSRGPTPEQNELKNADSAGSTSQASSDSLSLTSLRSRSSRVTPGCARPGSAKSTIDLPWLLGEDGP
ncbi:gallidermin family lantibiotic [Leisingera sp. XS_AS12]|uniref:gallidermin family lantibiotic n=1 Tax=Leisingera sp. XS_AS12 TaxID=3241294 RepID=UPI0035180F86